MVGSMCKNCIALKTFSPGPAPSDRCLYLGTPRRAPLPAMSGLWACGLQSQTMTFDFISTTTDLAETTHE
jgi:hypothetical protein